MMRAMRQQNHPFPVRSRLAWLLAMLALLWHVGMGVQSAGHQTRMALAPTPEAMLEVCTADGMVYLPMPDWGGNAPDDGDTPDPGVVPPYCALCAAAAMVALPEVDSVLPVPALWLVRQLQAVAPDRLAGHQPWALPLARAPPALF